MRQETINFILEGTNQQRAARIQNQIYSALEAVQGILEPELQGWSSVAGGKTQKSSPLEDTLENLDLATLRQESTVAYYRKPHGRVAIRNYVKFIFGAGVMIDFQEKEEEALGKILEWWRLFTKKNKWRKLLREIGTRGYRDGEVFIRKFKQLDGPLILRFIDPSKINDNDIVYVKTETGEVDVERVDYYKVNGQEIPGDEVIHIKIDVDRNVKRGMPILTNALPYLSKFDKWLDARMVLNIIRASVALVREVQGSPTDLTRIRSAQRSNRSDAKETNKAQMLRPGTILSGTPGVKYSMLSPNLDAKDAGEDGKTILRSVAAGEGFPDVFITADYSQANFASTAVSQNIGVREFEDRTVDFHEDIEDIIDWVLEDGIEKKFLPSTVQGEKGPRPLNTAALLSFPPLIRRDIAPENTAYKEMYEHKTLSGRTWTSKMGFDPDTERRFIEEEEEAGFGMTKPSANGDGAPKPIENRRPRERVTVQ